MYYILFGGRYSKENLALCDSLKHNWVTFDNNPENFLKALKILNLNNPNAYNLVLLDPYLAAVGKRTDYIGKVLRLNLNYRKIAIIKDSRIERTVELFRERHKFHELSRELDLVKSIDDLLSLN